MRWFLLLVFTAVTSFAAAPEKPRRVVIVKVDGMNEDQLMHAIEKRDPATGKSQLPWIEKVFVEQGTIYDNFYTRGISLSAPSWSMLDTGHPTLIRGNAEYDRYTGQIYDYLNFFPFYVGYARQKEADMPGVSVLDRAGVPLFIDHFPYTAVYQSFQLFQRGVRWTTLGDVLFRRFSSKSIVSMLEGATPGYDTLLEQETEQEIQARLKDTQTLYLDFYTGKVDHEGHATSDTEAMLKEFRGVDKLVGQIWTSIEHGPFSESTLLVMVSDHGMNNVPGIISQTYSLNDLLNSPAGGAHHVLTDREQLSDFKFRSLDPLLNRFISPSDSSFYLRGQGNEYPTAWLDIDGNERAALGLRNNDLNKIHILLLQLARNDLRPDIRKATAYALGGIIDSHRVDWSETVTQLSEELPLVQAEIDARAPIVARLPHRYKREQMERGEHRADWRLRQEFEDWKTEHAAYSAYLMHLKRLLVFEPDSRDPFKGKVSDLIPEMSLGDRNSRQQLRQYVVGLGPNGLVLTGDGKLDEQNSFRYVDYPWLFTQQRAQNRPQKELPEKPIDFVAMRIADPAPGQHAYWLYGDENNQLEILTDSAGRIAVKPLGGGWRSGLPLALFEDGNLCIPGGQSREAWLSEWHSEKDWFQAIHRTRYSNGVIGVVEEMSPIAERVPGRPGLNPVLLRYERRRRQLVQADMHIFASDHWNFNTRFPNPGGNHGSFLRISTHSVWMIAGTGIPTSRVEDPKDSLDFEPTLVNMMQLPAKSSSLAGGSTPHSAK